MKVYFTTDAVETIWHDEFNLKENIFAETRKMPTHLLSFVVTNYPYLGYEKVTNDGIILRTFHKGAAKDANFTDISMEILDLSINAVNVFTGLVSIQRDYFTRQAISPVVLKSY